jgi:hypothetical protein
MRDVALRRSFSALLLGLALGAPFVLVARAGSALVAPLAEASVGVLLRLSAPLTSAPVEAQPPTPFVEEAPALTQAAASHPRAQVRRAAPKGPLPALFVGRSTVLRLSQSAARPRGSFVGRTAEHPAGLQLSGVSGLGIGVQDGDVLIEALGISPRSPGEIVGAIIEARSKRVAALGGTLWRRGQTFHITVEQPY